jgi:hypothetical protein
LQPPVAELGVQQALVGVRLWRRTVHRNHARDVVAAELARQRQVAGNDALSGVGQRFADAEEAGVIRRNEAVSAGNVNHRTHAADAGRRPQSIDDESAP